jgi:hypothetical protein
MNVKQVIQSQYLAALAMLKQVIVNCPQTVWDAPDDKFKFWSKSYHAIFFVHFYLQDAEKDFVPWEKHHDPDGDIPFTKDEVLEYLAFAEKQVVERVPATNLEAESGFHWYRSINWNCSSSTSAIFNNTPESYMNAWELVKISNLAGLVTIKLLRSRNEQKRIAESLRL